MAYLSWPGWGLYAMYLTETLINDCSDSCFLVLTMGRAALTHQEGHLLCSTALIAKHGKDSIITPKYTTTGPSYHQTRKITFAKNNEPLASVAGQIPPSTAPHGPCVEEYRKIAHSILNNYVKVFNDNTP
jgi:hypothetical protein